MKAATIIVLYALATAGAWLTGIYVGAAWERESQALARAGLLCDRAVCVCPDRKVVKQ